MLISNTRHLLKDKLLINNVNMLIIYYNSKTHIYIIIIYVLKKKKTFLIILVLKAVLSIKKACNATAWMLAPFGVK